MGSLGLGSSGESVTLLPSETMALLAVQAGHVGMEGSQGVLVVYSNVVVIGAGSAVAGMVGTKVLPLRSSK